MVSSEALTQLPVEPASHAPSRVALDVDFERRWTAWVARGRVHEQSARRRGFVVGAAALLMGAAIAYAFVR
jgi:hypothetical protein